MGNLLREPELKPSNKPHLRGEDAQKEIILDSSGPGYFFLRPRTTEENLRRMLKKPDFSPAQPWRA